MPYGLNRVHTALQVSHLEAAGIVRGDAGDLFPCGLNGKRSQSHGLTLLVNQLTRQQTTLAQNNVPRQLRTLGCGWLRNALRHQQLRLHDQRQRNRNLKPTCPLSPQHHDFSFFGPTK
jgi:hypothetical protein